MGFFDSITAAFGKATTAISSVVSTVAAPISAIAAKIDAIVPHPSNGGFQNVVDVLKAPFTGGHVTANVENPTLKKGLELVANNPLTAAGIATGVIGGTKAAITLGVPKAAVAIAGAAPGLMPGNASTGGLIKAATSIGTSPMASTGGIITSGTGNAPSPNVGMITSGSSGATQVVNPPTSSRAPQSASKGSRKRRPRASRKPKRTKRSRRKSTRRSKRKVRRGTAKEYARPGGKKVFYAKNGRPYIKLRNGQARFVRGKSR